MKKTILFLCLCYLVGVTYAQEPFRVMFYNVENLFDCQHDTLKNDYEFLPDAPKGWTQARYHDKLAKILLPPVRKMFPIWWGFVKWKMIIA